MRRHSTMLASSAAAALAALAVTVAAPAIGDDGPPDVDDFVACVRTKGVEDAPAGPAVKPWLNERLERGDATTHRAVEACAPDGVEVRRPVEEVRACLVRHGAKIEGSDPAAIKRWMGEHAGDPEVRDAMKACDVGPPGVPPMGSCEPGQAGDPAGTTEERAAPSKPGTSPDAGL